MIRFLLSLALAFVTSASMAVDSPPIAAASDLKFALTQIAENFRRDTGHEVAIAFGSSGNFTQQIENGAPFELFLSADEAYVQRLADQRLTRDAGTLYAIGRVALFIPHGSPLKADPTLSDLKEAMADRRLKRFAIANPEHAPYGRAAREVLQRAGLWDAIAPRLVLGENASQAMQFAARGAQAGIVPYSLTLAPEAAKLGTASLLPEDWHAPLRQRMVLLKTAGPTAQAFHDYLQRATTQRILAQYGFALPSPVR